MPMAATSCGSIRALVRASANVFYPSGLWIVLFEFFLCDAQHFTLLIKEDAAAAGRALVERKNNGHANWLVSLR